MLWWFERNGVNMHIEILQLARGGYELRVVDADGHERVEQLADRDELAMRQKQVVDELAAGGWHRTGHWVL